MNTPPVVSGWNSSFCMTNLMMRSLLTVTASKVGGRSFGKSSFPCDIVRGFARTSLKYITDDKFTVFFSVFVCGLSFSISSVLRLKNNQHILYTSDSSLVSFNAAKYNQFALRVGYIIILQH